MDRQGGGRGCQLDCALAPGCDGWNWCLGADGGAFLLLLTFCAGLALLTAEHGDKPGGPKAQAVDGEPGKQMKAVTEPVGPKGRARTFWPNSVTEVERVVDGKPVLYIYYRAHSGDTGSASDMADDMQAEASEGDRLQGRKEAAEKSGQYDKAIFSPR